MRALITGITGQTGSYLAELLLDQGYEVHGLVRQSSTVRTQNIEHLLDPERRIQLHYGDITDLASIVRVLERYRYNEVYNLAAQAHVKVSFDQPLYTANATALGALNVLEAVQLLGLSKTRIYQASSSEMYGSTPPPQNEDTPFVPRSPYACAKAFAYNIVRNYREAYGLFICNGILFNHESPRRGQHYVTRKVTLSAARIKAGLQKELRLGNLASKRDWGYAKEYAVGIWKMMQQAEPDDYVLATGETHSVGELVELAFARVDLDWRDYVVYDPAFLRPTEVDALCGDASKAKRVFGWEARTKFQALVELMVDADMETLR